MTERAAQWTGYDSASRADLAAWARPAAPARSSMSALVTHSSKCARLAYRCAASLAALCHHVRVAGVETKAQPPANWLPHSCKHILLLVLETRLDGGLPAIALDWIQHGTAPRFAAAAVCGVGAREVRAVPSIRTLELWLGSGGTPIVVPALQAIDESDARLGPWCREVMRRFDPAE
jgi:hypothetical protein